MLFENLEIPLDALPEAEHAKYQSHPARYKSLRLLWLCIIFLILSAGWIILLFNEVEIWIKAGAIFLWACLFMLFLIEELKGFKVRGFALREHDISYKKGFFVFSLITIPFSRIQHSEISQGPIGRIFKLSTLKIYTAGGSSSDLRLGGLEPEEARQLRDFIAKTAGKKE